MSDRPPPTSYRDEHERWHPGPSADGYVGHMHDCLPCFRRFVAAHNRGERWAELLLPLPRLPPLPTFLPGRGEGPGARPDPDKVTPIAMPIAGPGVTRGELARRWRDRQPALRRTPSALVVWSIGAATGLVVALLPTAVAVVVTVGIWVCAVLATRYLAGSDRVPRARLLVSRATYRGAT